MTTMALKCDKYLWEAGLGFTEDPFCFHKGTVPVTKYETILEVKFASNNYEFTQITIKDRLVRFLVKV